MTAASAYWPERIGNRAPTRACAFPYSMRADAQRPRSRKISPSRANPRASASGISAHSDQAPPCFGSSRKRSLRSSWSPPFGSGRGVMYRFQSERKRSKGTPSASATARSASVPAPTAAVTWARTPGPRCFTRYSTASTTCA